MEKETFTGLNGSMWTVSKSPYNHSTLANPTTIDGVELSQGDRIGLIGIAQGNFYICPSCSAKGSLRVVDHNFVCSFCPYSEPTYAWGLKEGRLLKEEDILSLGWEKDVDSLGTVIYRINGDPDESFELYNEDEDNVWTLLSYYKDEVRHSGEIFLYLRCKRDLSDLMRLIGVYVVPGQRD